MAKGRANGEGNIRKRSDGRWKGRYAVGRWMDVWFENCVKIKVRPAAGGPTSNPFP